MNRLDRVTATLIHLQSKKVVTAREIAERFEVSLRTVYRDIRTLQEAGVPIGSENGVGYFIVEGYSLPPLMITEEEANALLISEKLLQTQGDQSLKKDFESLLIKIKAILRNSQKENVQKLEGRIGLSAKEKHKSEWLSIIQKSIVNTIALRIGYHSISKDEMTTRNVEPLAIYFTGVAWVLIAYCQLRKSEREFRLDRVLTLETTSEKFTFQEDFNLNSYFRQQAGKYSQP
ncbi:YafY family protein [Rapidithrix thailandica]|uniref:YafY family protein n=1 Tax=Rapidithrix thailandica TaxID=413964 RepID=A0AAW9SM38_9BACT